MPYRAFCISNALVLVTLFALMACVGVAGARPTAVGGGSTSGQATSGQATSSQTTAGESVAGVASKKLAAPVVGPLLHPAGPGCGQWRLGIGAELDVLPRLLVEAEMRLVPRLTMKYRHGLPARFTIDASASGNVFMNELRVGPAWSVALGPVTLGVRDRMGVFGGVVGVAGFDTSIWGLSNAPALLLGIALGSSYLSWRSEAVFTLEQVVSFGDETVDPSAATLAAWSNAVRVETPLGKGLINYGVDLVYAVADQQLWLVFSDARGRVLFPRFSVSYAR